MKPLDGLRSQDALLVQIVDAAFADSASRSGNHLVCKPGCTQCCYGAFAINELDALRLRTWMGRMGREQPEVAKAIQDRAEKYLAEFGTDFPGDEATGILDAGEGAQAAFEEFANDAACPALNVQTGLCEVYEARPMTCRVFGPPVKSGDEGVLGVCELCFTGATEDEIAAGEMYIPYSEEDALLAEIRQSPGGGEVEPQETIVAFCLLRPIA